MKKADSVVIQLQIKDQDAFGFLIDNCGPGYKKLFEFCEYATVELTVGTGGGYPIIAARFVPLKEKR